MLKVRVQYTPRHDAIGAFGWRKNKAERVTVNAQDLLNLIAQTKKNNPMYRYPYHTLFAYDEINKAAKRHGTKERDYEGF